MEEDTENFIEKSFLSISTQEEFGEEVASSQSVNNFLPDTR